MKLYIQLFVYCKHVWFTLIFLCLLLLYFTIVRWILHIWKYKPTTDGRFNISIQIQLMLHKRTRSSFQNSGELLINMSQHFILPLINQVALKIYVFMDFLNYYFLLHVYEIKSFVFMVYLLAILTEMYLVYH